MSRCFPYPPPGYEVKNGVLDLDLLESIKRESEKIKKERKERKKEKSREKKHKKDKTKESGDSQKKERSHEKRHKSDAKAGDSLKRKEPESEQLEKSCLTEEQGQPANTQNLYDSSDSTLNSNKRKRHSSPSPSLSDVSRSSGNSVLIKLPLQKHKDTQLPTSNEQVCSVSGRTEIITIARDEFPSLRACKQSCSTSGRNELHAQDVHVPTPPSSSSKSAAPSSAKPSSGSKSAPRGIDLQFRDLIENWVPPTLQIYQTDFDDQEWLFEMKPQRRHEAKRLKPSSNDVDLCRGSSGWPRACYLPAADIYALPYTVPF
ncbi:hypothetical protein MKW94_009397 [Papaver nudicaule]|uniref:Uncharacterized protein n=1 Tax=Papaver nudicaule TaxID=74823 RepID=A0AA41VZT9_PAPNU|nr:hypothetical protein [Papaver nudicaule]